MDTNKWNLFIDDERNPKDVFWGDFHQFEVYGDDDWIIARNMTEVLEYVSVFGMPILISFDHDLGKNEPTGYDIAKALVEMDLCRTELFPENMRIWVHSKNPIGAKNIEQYFTNYFNMKE